MAESLELLRVWLSMSATDDAAWAAAKPGPSVAAVAARLSSVPPAFLDDRVSIRALFGDVLDRTGVSAWHAQDRRVRQGAALGLWLLASETIVEPFDPPLRYVSGTSAVDALALRLAPVSDPLDWLSDDERREEAVRMFLLHCGHYPAGEDAATARSRLEACDSLRRDSALAEAYEAHRHRTEVARRFNEARAREAAARYSHE